MEKKSWCNKKIEEIEKELKTNRENGLKQEQIQEIRMRKVIMNYKQQKKKTIIQRFIDQFKDFSIIVLIIAAIVSGIVGVSQGEGITDTIIILIVVIVNAVIEWHKKAKPKNL